MRSKSVRFSDGFVPGFELSDNNLVAIKSIFEDEAKINSSIKQDEIKDNFLIKNQNPNDIIKTKKPHQESKKENDS